MKLQTSIVVNHPQEAVFECVSSVAFIQEWIAPIRTGRHGISYENGRFRIIHHTAPRIQKIEQMTEGPVMKGTVFKQGGGVAMIEVIEYSHPDSITFKIKSPSILLQEQCIFEKVLDGTRLILLADIQFQGCLMNLIGLLSIALTILLNSNALKKYSLEVKQYIEGHC